MARFRDIKTLQKFTAAHASIHNHFNHQRHLTRRDIFKTTPSRRCVPVEPNCQPDSSQEAISQDRIR